MNLNENAWRLCDELASLAAVLKVAVSTAAAGTRIIDCGVNAIGGNQAGRRLAEICMSGLGRVALEEAITLLDEQMLIASHIGEHSLFVVLRTDQPLLACMASQYAGWQITGENYFAMSSGPMRAVARREPLFEQLGYQEQASRIVGVLETSKLPTDAVCQQIAAACGVAPENLTLLVARTASIAGAVQIVARSVETALHKMHELGYDLRKVVTGQGSAPLPPVAADRARRPPRNRSC